ncbi:cobalamin-dependent protein [Deltaproteobacteria bacterium TL4]
MRTYQTATHPLGNKAKVLLTSVFGPYAQDDEYGSRKINPMELYQNQVTRVQGSFSLRMFHRSFGLLMIQSNISAPCTLLDFPTLDRFIEELKHNNYDIIGISAIIPNVGKVKKMCELIRTHQPEATLVIGGHIANKPDLDAIINADHIVKGEGIRWFRNYLGENENAPVKHPAVLSGFGGRIVGYALSQKPKTTAAILLPSVGCPMGCNFCSTSSFFGGKGKFINFYETGEELFKVMCDIEKKLKTRSFFILDENFLLHRKRALSLLELMKKHQKSWALSVFSSAKILSSYSMEQLVGLGIGWAWMGLEGEDSQYQKLQGTDTKALVKELQANGIRVLGSSIIGLETHTPENISQITDYAVSHSTVFHQFMLYTPVPGTPLHEQMQKEGRLLPEAEFPVADAHGQYRFNYKHPHLQNGQEEQLLLQAFNRDFEANGPSLARLIRVLLSGWQKYKNHPDPRVVERFNWEVDPVRSTYAGAVWGMKKWYQHNAIMEKQLDDLLQDIYQEFGWKTKIIAETMGRYAYRQIIKEEKKLASGWSYEPPCFYDKNEAALALERGFSIPFTADLPQIQLAVN